MERLILIFLIVLLVVCSVCGTFDVITDCPAEQWEIGDEVTMHCSVLKTTYQSKCKITGPVKFRTVPLRREVTCTLADATTCRIPLYGCTCFHNSTHFNFQYTFNTDIGSSGHYVCDIPCSIAITPELSYSNKGCIINVSAGPLIPKEAVQLQAVCLPEIWEAEMSTVTIQCFLQKSKFPSSCKTSYANKTHFRHSVDGGTTYSTVCTVSNILGKCASSGPCGCGTGNSTHYMFTYTFKVHKVHQGYWGCDVPCLNGGASLKYAQVDCKNKKVIDLPATKTDSSPNCLVIDVAAAGGVFVIAAVGAGVYCIRKRVSAGKQNAAPAILLPDNAHPDNAHPDNAPLHNAPLDSFPQANDPPASAPQANDPPDSAAPSNGGALAAGSDEESTGKYDDSFTDVQSEDSTVYGSEVSDATVESLALSE